PRSQHLLHGLVRRPATSQRRRSPAAAARLSETKTAGAGGAWSSCGVVRDRHCEVLLTCVTRASWGRSRLVGRWISGVSFSAAAGVPARAEGGSGLAGRRGRRAFRGDGLGAARAPGVSPLRSTSPRTPAARACHGAKREAPARQTQSGRKGSCAKLSR